MSAFSQLGLQQVQELAGDAAGLSALVAQFDLSLAEELARLDDDVTQSNAAEFALHLHALEGFVPLFSKSDLAQQIVALYAHCRQSPWNDTLRDWVQLRPRLLSLQQEVRTARQGL